MRCEARYDGPVYLAQVATACAHLGAFLLGSTTASSHLQMHCQAHCVGLEYLAQSKTPSAHFVA